MQWSLQKGTEMSMSPCHSNSFEGVGRESEGRSSILALCCHGLGGCWHCSKLPSAIREAFVWELEVQPRGHGPFLPSLGCVGIQSPGGCNLSFLFQWFFLGCYDLDFGTGIGCAALGVKNCISWLVSTQREAPALKGMLHSGFLFLSSLILNSLKRNPFTSQISFLPLLFNPN